MTQDHNSLSFYFLIDESDMTETIFAPANELNPFRARRNNARTKILLSYNAINVPYELYAKGYTPNSPEEVKELLNSAEWNPDYQFSNEKYVTLRVDEYLESDDTDTFHFTNGSNDLPFSVSCWANFNDITYGSMACKGESDANLEWMLTGWNNDEYTFRLQQSLIDQIAVTSNAAFTDDEGSWVHIVATYDGTGVKEGLKLYRNGVEISPVTRASVGSYNKMKNSGDKFNIGRARGNKYIDGSLDEMSIFNVELTSAQISELYNSGTPGNLYLHSRAQNILAWYRLGDGAEEDITADTGVIIDQYEYQDMTPKNTDGDEIEEYA